MDHEIGIVRIVCFQVNSIIMLAIHPWMHHENTGFDCGGLTGLEYHRSDGQVGRSAPLQNFDVRIFFES